MATQPIERKLAAIFAADIAGYSRLMARDEIGTLTQLKACRAIIDGLITTHRGRIFNTAGDSVVADFASAVDAVQCAIAVQEAITAESAKQPAGEPMQFRIGVHVGDVMVDGDNLLGDGVNIAARLESLAEPGAICVAAAARDHVGNKLPVAFDDLGDQQVKNIAQPIRVYRVQMEKPVAQPVADPPLPDKPSIAVLPFQNMSGDSEQDYFVDGMVEDIITGLSRIKWLFVIARNSSFAYKGRSPDIRQVGRELGVRYLLEGSVRKAAGRVRITGQLVEAETGRHIWAERYDRAMDDIFALPRRDHAECGRRDRAEPAPSRARDRMGKASAAPEPVRSLELLCVVCVVGGVFSTGRLRRRGECGAQIDPGKSGLQHFPHAAGGSAGEARADRRGQGGRVAGARAPTRLQHRRMVCGNRSRARDRRAFDRSPAGGGLARLANERLARLWPRSAKQRLPETGNSGDCRRSGNALGHALQDQGQCRRRRPERRVCAQTPAVRPSAGKRRGSTQPSGSRRRFPA